MNDIFYPTLLYFFTLLMTLWYYLRLVDRMKAEDIDSPPFISLFLVIKSHTMAVLVALSPLFFGFTTSSGLWMLYIIIVAPTIMIFVAAVNHGKRFLSHYHSGVYKASLIYLLVAPASAFFLFVLIWIK